MDILRLKGLKSLTIYVSNINFSINTYVEGRVESS